jgi:hypothetical protein
MDNIVAADFNPPMNNEDFSMSFVGTAHLIPFVCAVPTELNINRTLFIGGLKSAATK